jgi:cytochrome c553
LTDAVESVSHNEGTASRDMRPDLQPARRATAHVLSRGTPLAFVAVLLTVALAASSRAQTIEDKAQLCAACHGEDGVPQQKTTPVIWGQHLGYTYLQLRDYKSGARKNDIMSPLAQTMERDDMMAFARYFSQKRWPDLQQPPAPPDVTAQALRANVAIGCTGCHQAGYLGEGTQPRVAGQTREYLQQSMMDFRTRSRGNNPGMSDLMLAISPEDIAACAEYLAGLR